MGVNSALVRFTYPHSLLGPGIGLNALVVAFSAGVGPTLAASILAVGSWPWLFAINVPLGVVTLVLGLLGGIGLTLFASARLPSCL